MNDSQLGVAYQKSDRVGVAYQLSDRLSGCGLQIALKERQYFFLSTPSLPLFKCWLTFYWPVFFKCVEMRLNVFCVTNCFLVYSRVIFFLLFKCDRHFFSPLDVKLKIIIDF